MPDIFERNYHTKFRAWFPLGNVIMPDTFPSRRNMNCLNISDTLKCCISVYISWHVNMKLPIITFTFPINKNYYCKKVWNSITTKEMGS